MIIPLLFNLLLLGSCLPINIKNLSNDTNIIYNNNDYELDLQSEGFGLNHKGTKGINIKLNKFEELDVNNTVVDRIRNMRVYNMIWSIPSNNTRRNGLSTNTRQQFITKNKNRFNFVLETDVYSNPTNLTFANTTIIVPLNSIKFSFNISGWKFSNTSNTLEVGMEINSRYLNRYYNQNEKRNIILSDDGFYDMPSVALIDGVIRDITYNTYITENQKLGIKWTFPSFNNTIEYDPVIGSGTTTVPSNFVFIGTDYSPEYSNSATSVSFDIFVVLFSIIVSVIML